MPKCTYKQKVALGKARRKWQRMTKKERKAAMPNKKRKK